MPEKQINKLQFRNFVKDKLSEGIKKYSTIRELSGLDNEYEEYTGKIGLGEDRTWQRCISEKKRRDNGQNPNGITIENQTMPIYNEVERRKETVSFLHVINGREYFLIPSLLHYLSGNISGDGTFHPVKDNRQARQLYCLNIQLYSADRKMTHCQPIICVVLPDSKEVTYNLMWSDIKELYRSIVGQDLRPSVVHSDNELAFINSTKMHFPDARIITCFFHIKENIKKRLGDLGFNKNPPTFVVDKVKLVYGLLFVDLSDNRQLEMAHELLYSLTIDAVNHLIGTQLTNFTTFINDYCMKVWFNPRSVHFAGRLSNFYKDIELEETPQLTNNNNSMKNNRFS